MLTCVFKPMSQSVTVGPLALLVQVGAQHNNHTQHFHSICANP